MSNEKQETALDMFKNKLSKLFKQVENHEISIEEFSTGISNTYHQAKELEKLQHKVTYLQSLKSNFQKFEHYWETTYGGNK
jgi:SMC interacting uncharacterized protein involved in chromosome segregation